MFCQIV